MRFLIYLFLGLISTSSIYSQSWFDGDDRWIYRFNAWSKYGYSEVFVSHDTILGRHNAKVLKRSATYIDLALQNQDTVHVLLDDLIMREDGEKVYYWDKDSFAFCYDFGMGIDDYHVFKRPECGMDMWWVVKDTGSVIINGISRKTQKIQVTEIFLGHINDILVIQGIGITQIEFDDHKYRNYGYLVPQITYPCYADGIGYEFRCFSDNGQTYKRDTFDCHPLPEVRTSNSDISGEIAFSISPNPSHGKYQIDLDEENKVSLIKVMNSTGKVVYVSANASLIFDLGEKPMGVYYVQVLINGKFHTKRIIKM